MTKKEQLYYLVKEMKNGKYDVNSFCEEFITTLYYESNAISVLNIIERNIFRELAEVVERYSKYETDYRLYPNVYKNDADVKKAVEKAYNELFDSI